MFGRYESVRAFVFFVVDCGRLPALANGNYTLTNINDTSFEATAAVTCDPGYQSDVQIINCLSSGNWNETVCYKQGKRNRTALSNCQNFITYLFKGIYYFMLVFLKQENKL